jgi:hypothetical protein
VKLADATPLSALRMSQDVFKGQQLQAAIRNVLLDEWDSIGGGIEVVVPSGGVRLDGFHYSPNILGQ